MCDDSRPLRPDYPVSSVQPLLLFRMKMVRKRTFSQMTASDHELLGWRMRRAQREKQPGAPSDSIGPHFFGRRIETLKTQRCGRLARLERLEIEE